MTNAILHVVEYFSYFHYAPTVEQIYRFLTVKVQRSTINGQLSKLKSNKQILIKRGRVVFPKNSVWLEETEKRCVISEQKIRKNRKLIKLLGRVPGVQFIGISGSVSAMNAHETDDIDLFVITAHKQLWTARFLLTVLATLVGKRRKRGEMHIKDKLCFNLFFSEENLAVPKRKQTVYVGHEVLQVLPIVNKNKTYERFLEANKWVERLFPNINSKFKIQNSKSIQNSKNLISNLSFFIETVLAKVQLGIISRHRTTEYMSNTQLWFFPDDFEQKLTKSKKF